jgi:hypothetical protein
MKSAETPFVIGQLSRSKTICILNAKQKVNVAMMVSLFQRTHLHHQVAMRAATWR